MNEIRHTAPDQQPTQEQISDWSDTDYYISKALLNDTDPEQLTDEQINNSDKGTSTLTLQTADGSQEYVETGSGKDGDGTEYATLLTIGPSREMTQHALPREALSQIRKFRAQRAANALKAAPLQHTNIRQSEAQSSDETWKLIEPNVLRIDFSTKGQER